MISSTEVCELLNGGDSGLIAVVQLGGDLHDF